MMNNFETLTHTDLLHQEKTKHVDLNQLIMISVYLAQTEKLMVILIRR